MLSINLLFLLFVKLFQKFLLKSLVSTTAGVTLILTSMIWLAQLLRFSRMIAYQGLSSQSLLTLSLSLLPKLLLVTLPLGFLVSLVWRYNRLISDNERDVMSACGLPPWFFAWPSVAWALCLTLILYILSLYLAPLAASFSKQREYVVRHHLDPSFITPGVFFQIENKTLYVHRQKDRYLFEGVFIYDEKNAQRQDIITGQYAYIIPKNMGLEISLRQGTHQQIFPNKPPSILAFDHYTLHFAPKGVPLRQKHVQELSLKELKASSFDDPKVYHKEWKQRLLFPLLPLINALWCAWALLYLQGRIWPTAVALVGACGLYALIFTPWSTGLMVGGCLGAVLGLWIYSWIKA